jgi:hypothetical protein
MNLVSTTEASKTLLGWVWRAHSEVASGQAQGMQIARAASHARAGIRGTEWRSRTLDFGPHCNSFAADVFDQSVGAVCHCDMKSKPISRSPRPATPCELPLAMAKCTSWFVRQQTNTNNGLMHCIMRRHWIYLPSIAARFTHTLNTD